MGLIVADAPANFSAATWYRGEAWQLDMTGTAATLSTDRYTTLTFANAGNIRGVIHFIGSSIPPVGRSAHSTLQRGRTATMTIAAPGVVTLTGHGFAALAACTISIATPGVVTQVAHGLVNGDIVGFTTTGALPTGLVNTTPVYVVNKTADTF
jgi:hypothetical protein